MQADYLRYCALLHFGGVWADAGFACVRNITPLLEHSQGGELFRSFAMDSLLMKELLAFPASRHPFLRLAVELSTGLIERRWDGKVNEITGPFVVTAIYRLHQAGSIDALLTEMDEAQKDVPHLDLTLYGRLVCEIIGDSDRAKQACEGIRVFPAKCRSTWVRSPRNDLPHRNSDSHWSHLSSQPTEGRARLDHR